MESPVQGRALRPSNPPRLLTASSSDCPTPPQSPGDGFKPVKRIQDIRNLAGWRAFHQSEPLVAIDRIGHSPSRVRPAPAAARCLREHATGECRSGITTQTIPTLRVCSSVVAGEQSRQRAFPHSWWSLSLQCGAHDRRADAATRISSASGVRRFSTMLTTRASRRREFQGDEV